MLTIANMLTMTSSGFKQTGHMLTMTSSNFKQTVHPLMQKHEKISKPDVV